MNNSNAFQNNQRSQTGAYPKKWLLRIAFVVAAVIGVAAVLAGWYLYPLLTLNDADSEMALELESDILPGKESSGFGFKRLALGWFHGVRPIEKNVRILILGFDETSGAHSGRTDVIIVAELDPARGIGIVSIPRDLWVPIPTELWVGGKKIDAKILPDAKRFPGSAAKNVDGAGMDESDSGEMLADSDTAADSMPVESGYNRINTVYRLGNRMFGKGMGHVALKKVLAEQLGLEVDYTVGVDYEGFRQSIDFLGGVTVNVQCPVRDNFVSKSSPTGYEYLDVAAGRRNFNGHDALLFMRSRHGRTDMDRSLRQQQVLQGLRTEILQEKNFLALPNLVSTMMRFVKTDADLPTILQLAAAVKSMPGGIHGMVLTPPLVTKQTTASSKSILVLNKAAYDEKRKKLFFAPSPGDRGKKICPAADVALNWREKRKTGDSDSPVLR